MAYKTVSSEDAAQYPELKDRVGETISADEFVQIQRSNGDAQTTEERVAAAKENAPDAAPRKRTTKKSVKKPAK